MGTKVLWYVARGKEHTGPFTTDELREQAEQGRLSVDDQISRSALEGWRRAGDVPELLPTDLTGPSPPLASTPLQVQAARSQPDPLLVGVKGWLLLLCIWLTILSPVLTVRATIYTYGKMSPMLSRVSGLHDYFTANHALILVINLSSLCVGILLWTRQPGAHRITQWYLLSSIVLTPIAYFVIFVFVNDLHGYYVFRYAFFEIIKASIPALICYWYLEKSARVRATFWVDLDGTMATAERGALKERWESARFMFGVLSFLVLLIGGLWVVFSMVQAFRNSSFDSLAKFALAGFAVVIGIAVLISMGVYARGRRDRPDFWR